MKDIGIYKLLLDNHQEGIFTSMKALEKHIYNWEESYFNQDEFDVNYRPKWEIVPYEGENNIESIRRRHRY